MEMIINGGRSNKVEESTNNLEGARKRLRENYEKIEAAKKQRRLIVIEPVTRTTTFMKKTPLKVMKVTNTMGSKKTTEEQRLITQSWAQAKMSFPPKVVLPVKMPQKIFPVVKKPAAPTMMTAKRPALMAKNRVFGSMRDHLAATGKQMVQHRNQTPLASLDPVSLALKLETARSLYLPNLTIPLQTKR